MVHICTDETFLVDCLKYKSTCLICNHESILRIGWVGEKCDLCGSVIDPSEITIPDIVKLRRNKMGLNRPDMAKLIGYSKHTIKKYEFTSCSMKYYNLTTKLITEYYGKLISDKNTK